VKNFQISLEDVLVRSLARAVKKLNTTRSAFVSAVLKEVLRNLQINQFEEQHRQGYQRKQASKNEFGIWEKEQMWAS